MKKAFASIVVCSFILLACTVCAEPEQAPPPVPEYKTVIINLEGGPIEVKATPIPSLCR